MSGGGGGPIIIPKALEVTSCTEEEKKTLREILNRSSPRCSRRDAFTVARIIYSLLRRA